MAISVRTAAPIFPRRPRDRNEKGASVHRPDSCLVALGGARPGDLESRGGSGEGGKGRRAVLGPAGGNNPEFLARLLDETDRGWPGAHAYMAGRRPAVSTGRRGEGRRTADPAGSYIKDGSGTV